MFEHCRMMKVAIRLFVLVSFALLLCASACRERSSNNKPRLFQRFLPPDTSLCEVDSSRISAFIDKYHVKDSLLYKLHTFYSQRSYKAAWTNNSGVNEYAGNFVNLLNNEARQGKDHSSEHLLNLQALYVTMLDNEQLGCGDSLFTDLEMMLSLNFFDYAKRTWGGMSDDMSKRTGWFIVRKQMNYEQLLEDFLSEKKQVNANDPVNRQYSLLQKHAARYARLEKEGKWPVLPEKLYPLKSGDVSPQITQLKKLLRVTGDLTVNDTSSVFTDAFAAAVSSFQSRHGLEANGKLTESTLAAMKVPLHDRLAQILINMERSRWVPSEVEGSHVVVNIPQFKMHVYEDDQLVWSSNVIVGKSNAVNKTIIFNDSIELIVFSPYWNITQNIITREVLPEVKKDKGYLDKNNLEIVDSKGAPVDPDEVEWDKYEKRFPYVLRERPGPANSLGKVKFLFPNAYDIYMHDTPAKALFSKTSRSFSHGCIRLSEPERFARYLLRDEKGWDSLKIREAMDAGVERFVKLSRKTPVFIAYFTAWVDREGRLNFADDIYGHDEKMKQMLFVN